MTIPSVPTSTTPSAFKTWAEAVTTQLNLLPSPATGWTVVVVPPGGIPVFATTSQATADAYPEYNWLVYSA